jgi:predicted DNA-binding transcriptional regulator YafY
MEALGAIEIVYTNHRGETATRTILPILLWFGTSEWHSEEQWFLDAFDYGKNAQRTFAVRDIKAWDATRPASDTSPPRGPTLRL